MTVLEAEEDEDEQLVPPRKKFCLSLSRRGKPNVKKTTQPPRTSTRGGTLNRYPLPNGESTMLNGYRNQLPSSQETMSSNAANNGVEGLRVATLCNLGNTCFLNSVLYTLRFAPSFLHNLHHLATDLSNLTVKQLQTKMKSSSLGRTGVSLTASGSRSWSSKDLLALSGPMGDSNKPRIQVATEKLHELFAALRTSEMKDSGEPYQPDAFLQALREVNPIFEGNQQQDAHELLVCLLDNIRETFQLLVRHRESQFGQSGGGVGVGVGVGGGSDLYIDQVNDVQSEGSSSKRGFRKSKKKKKFSSKSSLNFIQSSSNGTVLPPHPPQLKQPFENGHSDAIESNGDVTGHQPESKKCFISEDFEGVSLLRTTCLECEHVTERKETFCDIYVPIDTDQSNEKEEDRRSMDSSEVYKRAVVTSELLRGRDKYWCACCLRYNEARRAVCFPSLPRLLILQLKRFSTTAGSMEKINNHMPTPLTLQCFCEDCLSDIEEGGDGRREARHVYKLYSVIMHQGATMTAGHYVAYTRLPDESASSEYFHCDRDNKREFPTQNNSNISDKSSSGIMKFFRSKSNVSENKEQLNVLRVGCRSMECCGIRRGKHTGSWLECDDEAVRIIPLRELEEKLAPNPRNSATPYLLFYVRSTT